MQKKMGLGKKIGPPRKVATLIFLKFYQNGWESTTKIFQIFNTPFPPPKKKLIQGKTFSKQIVGGKV